MHVAGHEYNLLSASEVSCIHRNAVRILSEIGMEVQNQLDADLAREQAVQAVRVFQPEVHLSPAYEAEILALIARADKEVAS